MDGGNFDQLRTPVEPAVLDTLLAPEPGAEALRRAGDALDRHVREMIEAGTGVVMLTGLPTEPEVARAILLRATELLGRAMPQNREGEMVREVRDRGAAIGEGERARYSDSRFGGNLHTDGAEAPLPVPDLFTLYCLRQAPVGGALQLLHVSRLEEALAARPGVLKVLREPFHFDRRGDQQAGEARTTAKPVLFDHEGRTAITYLRRYIEIGHEYDDVPDLTAEQVEALDALDALTARPGLLRQDWQRPGELALFDNLRVLHGRTTFQDSGTDEGRLLLRTWVRRPAVVAGRADPR
jgi:hypothetical protein